MTTDFVPTIVQVLNIAPTATSDQVKTLFGFLGDINNLVLYNSDQNSETSFKVCFVEYSTASSVALAQHLTNTVFIDRALTVLPYDKNEIPNCEETLSSLTESKYITHFDCGVFSHLVSGPGGAQFIATVDPRYTALGVSQYPHLPISTEPSRVEEIRRTVYIGNLDSTVPPDQVLKFFNDIGEVKYIRMAGDDTQPTRFAFVEYFHQSSIANALQHNGDILGSRPLKINHSNNAIVKPQPKIETDDISRRTRDRSSSRDFGPRERYHSSRFDRDRTRAKDRERDRADRHHDHRRSSRSRHSKSRDRSRSRSRDRNHRDRSSRDKSSKRYRSRSPDARRHRSRSKSIERSKSRHRKSKR